MEVDRVDQTSEKRFPFDLPKKLGAKCPYVRDVTELSEREGATERGGREKERERENAQKPMHTNGMLTRYICLWWCVAQR